MLLSKIIKEFNQILTENENRPNKLHEGTLRKPQNREVLALPSSCEPNNLKTLLNSKTKVFIDLWAFERMFEQFLKSKFPKVEFSITKIERSLFAIRSYELTPKAIGLGAEYEKDIDMFMHIAYINVKQKKSVFGAPSAYDHSFGKPEAKLMVNQISIEENQDCDPVEELKETILARHQRKIDAANEKANDKQAFEEALKVAGITLGQFKNLQDLYSKTMG